MSGQMIVKPDIDGLAASAQSAAPRGPAPVHLWNPPHTGDMDLVITRDGTWVHEGRPITRTALVRLFASILRRDGDDYVLVTPVEKVGITVEDAPFVAVDFSVTGAGTAQEITFTTNLGDTVTAGAETPIRVETHGDTPAPYVTQRANLEARIDRKSFYRLVEIGTHHIVNGADWFGVWSGGVFFPIIASDALD